ncbi:MAG: hypothetical protein KME60_00665 [Cyanomargarita calcarea GSE-NOS-MK-12-04C]|uniref:Resolvase HTH domain-containing protein n=1 Tax=Cyanomargarita calcarea GSE-NOS-MK-12-04C TaxID=2839659 RepID=A0A951QHW7_9CYAN|nr:hypothetical protein [Cyanomargarita calcarea GSE-NOS-MK-12-04C]
MDEQLQKLINEVCRHPDSSLERQKALNRLLGVIQKFSAIYKSSHQDYLEALNLTWEWVSRKICEFEKRSPSLEKSLVIWINGYLKWRIKDLYAPNSNYIISLDKTLRNNEGNETTLLERFIDPELVTLDLLDIKIAKIQEQKRDRLGRRIGKYIELDESRKLRGSHIKPNPECHCQLLAMRLLLQKPPHKIIDIAREFNVNNQTLHSHWKRKCLPLLREIGINFGYEP